MTRALVLALALFTSTAHAQELGGLEMGGGGAPGAPAGATSGSSSSSSSSAMGGARGSSAAVTSAPSLSPDALFGLKPIESPPLLSLDDAIARASAHNYDLRIAREKITQQETQVRKAWSYLLPQVSLGGSYTFNCTFGGDTALADCNDQTVQFVDEEQLDNQIAMYEGLGDLSAAAASALPNAEERAKLEENARQFYDIADAIEAEKGEIKPIVVQPAHVFGANLSVSVPVFNGRALPLLQNAYSAVDAVELGTTQARNAVLLGVTRAYYTAFAAKRMVAIATEQRESAVKHRDAVKSRVELQALPPLSLKRAELDVIRAEMAVRQASAGYRSAVAAVGQLAGLEEEIEVVEPPAPPTVDEQQDAEALIAQACSSRPELRSQKVALEIAERSRLDAWMMFLPSVNLVAQGRATSNSDGFVASPLSGALMLTATLPLYDGGLRYAAMRESASKIREELLRVRQVEERIKGQVRGNVDDVRLKGQALELAREALDVARAGAEQAGALYDVGAATPLDVSDANLALFVAEAELMRAELELQQARLGLAYVVGAFPSTTGAAEALTPPEEEAARARVAPLP